MSDAPSSIEDQFAKTLADLARRPAVYVGSPSLLAIAHYLSGYNHAVDQLAPGREPFPFLAWQRWIEWKFGIFHPAWHWTRILKHVYEDEVLAIRALPELYDRLRRDLHTQGGTTREAADYWERELRARLVQTCGQDFYEPRTSPAAPFEF